MIFAKIVVTVFLIIAAITACLTLLSYFNVKGKTDLMIISLYGSLFTAIGFSYVIWHVWR